MARGAEAGEEYLRARHTGLRQLFASGRPAIEEPSVGAPRPGDDRHRRVGRRTNGSRQKPSCQLPTARPRLFEPVSDIAANLIAAGADGRADGRHEVGGTTPEFPGERPDRRSRYAGRKATPSGMRAGHGARAGVGEEQRNAVGRLDGQSERVIAGHDDVGLRAAAADILRDHDLSTMNLMNSNEPRRAYVHRPRDVVPGRRIIATKSRETKRPGPRGKDVGR